MKQYVVVSILSSEIEPIFERSAWPLHLTLAGPFFSNHEFPEIAEKIKTVADTTIPLTIRGIRRKMFGRNHDVEGTVVERSTELYALHNNILDALKGMITIKIPEHNRTAYTPHVSDRPTGKLLPHHTATVDAISLVELLPDKGVILATMPIV